MRLPSAISQVVPSPLHTLSLCVTPPLLPTAHQTSFFLCSGSLGPKASNVLCFWFRLMLYPGSTFPRSPRPCAVWPGVALGPLLALEVGVAIRRGPCLTLTVQQRWDAGCFCRRSLTPNSADLSESLPFGAQGSEACSEAPTPSFICQWGRDLRLTEESRLTQAYTFYMGRCKCRGPGDHPQGP